MQIFASLADSGEIVNTLSGRRPVAQNHQFVGGEAPGFVAVSIQALVFLRSEGFLGKLRRSPIMIDPEGIPRMTAAQFRRFPGAGMDPVLQLWTSSNDGRRSGQQLVTAQLKISRRWKLRYYYVGKSSREWTEHGDPFYSTVRSSSRNISEQTQHRARFAVVAYVKTLSPAGRVKAAEYVWRVLSSCRRRLWSALQHEPWFSKPVSRRRQKKHRRLNTGQQGD
jgi:hypothetical protein